MVVSGGPKKGECLAHLHWLKTDSFWLWQYWNYEKKKKRNNIATCKTCSMRTGGLLYWVKFKGTKELGWLVSCYLEASRKTVRCACAGSSFCKPSNRKQCCLWLPKCSICSSLDLLERLLNYRHHCKWGPPP